MSKKKIEKETGSETNKQDLLREIMQPYFDSYPEMQELYVTSDNTPFIKKQWAIAHQNTVDAAQKVITLKR